MKWPSIATHDGRRAYAFLAILGGCITFTALIVWSLWELRGESGFIFWLALAAHGQVFIGMGAIGWAMGRRAVFSVTREGVTSDDSTGVILPAKPAAPVSAKPDDPEEDA